MKKAPDLNHLKQKQTSNKLGAIVKPEGQKRLPHSQPGIRVPTFPLGIHLA